LSSLDGLSEQARDDLLRVVSQGGYNLLLGAGASADSKNPFGNDIPMAAELSDDLAKEFKVPGDGGLLATYDRACRDGRTDDVYQYLRKRMHGCKAAGWYQDLVRVPWSRIWTLNIDDVVENAYQSAGSSAWSRPQTLSWDDGYREGDSLQIVHLHGHTGPAKPKRLAFSILDYLNIRSSRNSWHPIFGDEWESKPFIILGASLTKEFDLADVIRQRNPSSPIPTVYVSRTIGAGMRFDLQSWNVIAIEATAEQFMADLYAAVSPLVNASDRIWGRSTNSRATALFSQDFRRLESSTTEPVLSSHDFYRGDPPLWVDVVGSLAAELEWVQDTAEAVIACMKEKKRFVFVATGPRFTGKTTGLLSLAQKLEERQYAPFLFRGDSGLNIDSASSILGDNPHIVLLFDGVHDMARSVNKLLERCRNNDATCAVVVVERDVRMPPVTGGISEEFLNHETMLSILPHKLGKDAGKGARKAPRLSPVDARSVVNKLTERGRLDHIEQLSEMEQVRVFRDNGLFAGMEIVSHGPKFRARIEEQVATISDIRVLRLLFLVSALDSLGMATHADLLSVVEPDREKRGELTQSSEGMDLLIIQGGRFFARHRSLGLEAVSRALNHETISQIMTSTLRFISPYVTEETLRQSTYHANVCRSILRAKSQVSWIGENNLEAFYDDLLDEYSWNSRYWEQRAIAAELRSDWPRAISYASRAATMTPDDHRLTTLGVVIFRDMLINDSPGSSPFEEKFERGLTQFRLAHRAREQNPVPVAILLDWLVQVAEAFHSRGLVSPRSLTSAWNRWVGDAKAMTSFHHGDQAEDLVALEHRWLRAFLSEGSR
jgi:hypothetical protein